MARSASASAAVVVCKVKSDIGHPGCHAALLLTALPQAQANGAIFVGDKGYLGTDTYAEHVRLLPEARVGHLGMARDERAHKPVDYYSRLPPGLADSWVFVLDPMLATGGSAVNALDHLKSSGATRLGLVCLVAAPEGIAAVADAHPEVRIWTAAVDRGLDHNAYIRPGLGDAGDRVFGTT
jgi:uracil phosphoribosyltransferase